MAIISPKIRDLPERPIELEQLPRFIPRVLAARFASLSTRSLLRHEGHGLTPIRRGQQTIYYERGEFLRWLGIQPPDAPVTAPAMRQPRKARR